MLMSALGRPWLGNAQALSCPWQEGSLPEKSEIFLPNTPSHFSLQKEGSLSTQTPNKTIPPASQNVTPSFSSKRARKKGGGVNSLQREKRYKFLFPLHRVKGELSKRESQYGKIELYKKQIQEKKKLAFFYGNIPRNSLKKLINQADNPWLFFSTKRKQRVDVFDSVKNNVKPFASHAFHKVKYDSNKVGECTTLPKNLSTSPIKDDSQQNQVNSLNVHRAPSSSTFSFAKCEDFQGKCKGGVFSDKVGGLVTLLESRLDVALFRASFFPSISMARQWISHNKVAVNKKKVRAPSYQLKGGDCIEILPAAASFLKRTIKERILKILPFRRSRKKLVTPFLIENYSSLEGLFPKGEKDSLFVPATGKKESFSQKQDENNSIKGQEEMLSTDSFFKEEGQKTQNFSLIKNHLQSIWENNIDPQRSRENSFHKETFWNLLISFRKSRGSKSERFAKQSVRQHSAKESARRQVNRFQKGGEHFAKQDVTIPPAFTKRAPLPEKKRRPLILTKMHPALQKGITLFSNLEKRKVKPLLHSTTKLELHLATQDVTAREGFPFDSKNISPSICKKTSLFLHFLKAKQALLQPRNRIQKLAGLQISGVKPLHLEISYKLLTAVFLYSPQKVGYPSNLDFPLIMRSFK